MKGIASIQQGKSFNEIRNFINANAMEIARTNAPKSVNIYSSLIKDTMRVIDENLGNEKLSLRWIAGTVLYTNVDYLGKIFKKETGMNFSHYVMEKRMECAKKLIMDGQKDRIYEVAEKVGYGSNSQYFSQVFKKYTGISPLEYKEITRTITKKKYGLDSKKA
jgi:two-component system response regulator YesN